MNLSMKTLLLTTLLLIGLQTHAQMQMLPEVSVDDSILGGHIIMIDMKDLLLISGTETLQIESEIGIEQKNKLLISFLMTEDASEIQFLFAGNNHDKPATEKIIQRYRLIRLKQTSMKILN